jgi:TetR/AcrR family transcriptional repressor of mexJK operon
VAAKSAPLRAAGRNRRQSLIKAATRLFLMHGFDAVSVDAIVKQSGGSKASVYDLFGNKEALFGAVVEDRCTHLMDTMATANPREMPIPAALDAIAKQFMALILSRDALGLYRVVVAETPRIPNLGATFFRHGPARAIAALAEYLEGQMRAGRLRQANARQAAEHFIGLLISTYHLRAVLGLKRGSASRHIAAAVAAFLQAYTGR